MKTLVIHPNDQTTIMLEHVYKNHPEYTICRDNGISKSDLRDLIKNHDRIIMLGHGTPDGLINSARNGYVVDSSFVDILKDKETYSVWCYSDKFFRKHNMSGFHTGMIISEVMEEHLMLGHAPLNESEIFDNMILFAKLLGDCIEETPIKMQEYMLANYASNDEVTRFNRERIFVL